MYQTDCMQSKVKCVITVPYYWLNVENDSARSIQGALLDVGKFTAAALGLIW